MTHEGIPTPGTVVNRHGRVCPRARRSDYPLYATCATCGSIIRCADGTADWGHVKVDGPYVTRTYTVSVTTDSTEHADLVMAERLDHDETYGFDYRVEWEGTP